MDVVQALTVFVPTQRLLDLARKFRNSGLFTEYTRDVVCDAATNHTPLQIVSVISGIQKEFSNLGGMKDVATQVVSCIKPFLVTDDDTLHGEEEHYISLGFTPDDIRKIAASSKAAEEKTDASVVATRNKLKENGFVDNEVTTYYMLLVFVRYTPKTKLFDLYYAYVHCKDYDAFQWIPGTDKKKLLASLKLEGINLLGTTLAGHHSNAVIATADDTGFKSVEEDLK